MNLEQELENNKRLRDIQEQAAKEAQKKEKARKLAVRRAIEDRILYRELELDFG